MIQLFFGISSSANIQAVWMVGMSKKHPFNSNFSFENKKKSQRAKSGEFGG